VAGIDAQDAAAAGIGDVERAVGRGGEAGEAVRRVDRQRDELRRLVGPGRQAQAPVVVGEQAVEDRVRPLAGDVDIAVRRVERHYAVSTPIHWTVQPRVLLTSLASVAPSPTTSGGLTLSAPGSSPPNRTPSGSGTTTSKENIPARW